MSLQGQDSGFTAEQIAQLIGFGECFVHIHPKEVLGFQDRLDLENATPITNVTTTTYSPTDKDEILLVDTSAGNVTITLPPANKGREFQVIKVAGGNMVTVVPSPGESILGSTAGVVFSNIGTSIRLKSVLGTGYWLL